LGPRFVVPPAERGGGAAVTLARTASIGRESSARETPMPADTILHAPPPALENIEEVARLEEQSEQRRSAADKIADAVAGFVGSVSFVVLHLLWFGAWVAINTGFFAAVPVFDPYPFVFLCMIVSLEGVLLSTFVLIKQNRMSNRADQRAHLDLQVNLLAEKEVTKIIEMIERISAQLGIEREVVDAEARELGQETAVGRLAEEVERKLPRHD
jgi:uncharacterized membrane protein